MAFGNQASLAPSERLSHSSLDAHLEYPSNDAHDVRTSRYMTPPHRDRRLRLAIPVAALALLATAPASALAAGEEGAEPSEVTAPSGGWTSGGEGSEASDSGANAVEGTALGSGGGPTKSTPTHEATAPSSSGSSGSASQPPPSSTYEEPSTGTAPTTSATVTPEAAATTAPATPAPSTHAAKPAPAPEIGVGAATMLGHSGARVAHRRVTSATTPEPLTSLPTAAAPVGQTEGASSGSSSLLWLLVGAIALALVYAGVRSLYGWRRRRERRVMEDVWRQRHAEWDEVVRRIKLERTPKATKARAKRSRAPAKPAKPTSSPKPVRADAPPDIVISKTGPGTEAGQRGPRMSEKPAAK